MKAAVEKCYTHAKLVTRRGKLLASDYPASTLLVRVVEAFANESDYVKCIGYLLCARNVVGARAAKHQELECGIPARVSYACNCIYSDHAQMTFDQYHKETRLAHKLYIDVVYKYIDALN